MNEPSLLLHAEMYIGLHALAWAIIMVLLVHVNLILAVKGQSTTKKFAISHNEHSLTLNCWLGKCLTHLKTRAQINGYQTKHDLKDKTGIKRVPVTQFGIDESDSRISSGEQTKETPPENRSGQNSEQTQPISPNKGNSEQTQPTSPNKGNSEQTKPTSPNKGNSEQTKPTSPNKGNSEQTKPTSPNKGNSEQTKPTSPNKGNKEHVVNKKWNSSNISNTSEHNDTQHIDSTNFLHRTLYHLNNHSAHNNQTPDSTTKINHEKQVYGKGNLDADYLQHVKVDDLQHVKVDDLQHVQVDDDLRDGGSRSNLQDYPTNNHESLPFDSTRDIDEAHYSPGTSFENLNQVKVTSEESERQRRSVSSPAPVANNRNIRAREEGDAIIGALFPLHHAPKQRSAYTRQCGEIREYYGIQRVEVFIMTLEKINRDPTILPHIRLGWDIRDSCWYSAIALENSIDFIKDAIASQSKSLDRASAAAAAAAAAPDNSSLGLSQVSLQGNKGCQASKNLKPIVGLVGPGSSESSIQVQNLLQIFNIPQIGYSATSIDLSDKSHFKYFLRVVPPDRYQAQALVDILVKFNWTYISTVHSDGNYGVRGMEKFTDLAKAKGICIAASDNVASTAEDSAFDSVLDNLLETPNASVVVCFCEGNTVKNIFMATRRKHLEGRFLFIGSDGWGNRLDVVEDLETAAAGGISIKLYSPPLSYFREHYDKLKPSSFSKNPWLNEFWEWKFKCSLDKARLRGHTRACVGNESLVGSLEDSKLGFVVNAVTAMARGLHNMHQDVCPGSLGLCPAMEPLNGSVYLQYLLNVSFDSYSGEAVHFDGQGDPPGRYEILNYQPITSADGNVTYDYVTIGHWITGELNLTGQSLYWPKGRQNGGQGSQNAIISLCSEPCKRGQAKKVKGVTCCWICTTCLENEILVDNNTDCKPCDHGHWPNVNKTDCEDIPVDFIDWSDTQAIVSVSLGCLGICVTVWVFAIFARYHDTPVVKASTRELSYIILIGICLAFSSNFFIVAKPSRLFCYLTRIMPGLSFSLIYGALVTRTNRIARILEGSKRIMTKKPRFMSATAQVFITGIIIILECAVIAGMLVYEPAESTLDYPAPKKVRLVCDTSTPGIVVPLAFDLLLIILCTLYAVKTRNLPENFNEAKFIGFTMYSTCVIWMGFFPIYFAGDNKEITLSLSISLSAAIALLLLFVPKVYVIVWVPERNTRGAFTTSKDVRCHIGSKSMVSGDSIDIKESNTFDGMFKSEKGQSKYWRQKSLDEKRLRFVMQRAPAADGETPYINHGVLPNSKLRTAFLDKDSKDSSRTDTTPVSSLSCPDKERIFQVEYKEATNVEMIRQNLARDYPMQKRQVSLRPGSPAEKEKHRIHAFDGSVDLDMLLGVQTVHNSRKSGKPGDFRKSLSSTCVSTYSRTRTVQCQTSDDLVSNLLPPLRKRCVPKNKNKLERSGAVDDTIVPATTFSKEVRVFNYPTPSHTKALTIHRSPTTPPHIINYQRSPSKSPSTSSPTVFHSCGPHDFDSSSGSDTESPYLLQVYNDDHLQQRRHSHNIPRLGCYMHNPDTRRRCSNDPSSSFLLSTTESSSLQTFKPQLLMPPDTTDFSFMEGVENFEDAVSPVCKIRCDQFFRYSSKDLPDAGLSPSSHSENDPTWSRTSNEVSSTSLVHQDSCGSTSISTTSSSFTLPPFPDSIDSHPSEEACGGSDTNLETTENNIEKYTCDEVEEINECVSNSQGRISKQRTDITLKPNNTHIDVPVVSPVSLDPSQDIVEFQKYLQGHGVKIDLSSVQSSDL